MKPRRNYSQFLPSANFYVAMSVVGLLFFVSYFFPLLFLPAQLVFAVVLLLALADYSLLFFGRGGLSGERLMAERFSLGDNNPLRYRLHNDYSFAIFAELVDELPFQFQLRSFVRKKTLPRQESLDIMVPLRPLTRGEYSWGRLAAYASTALGLVSRRFELQPEGQTVKVYPAFRQLRNTELMAFSDRQVYGGRRVRRLGHSLEFEKIKDYVQGDDVRTINWKATARRGELMVNTYTDARQQLIYCVLDKGRSMHAPFDGLTLLDHSINASLALLNIVLQKGDRAGLITFNTKVNEMVPADRRSGQMQLLLEALYRQRTDYLESDYEALLGGLHRSLSQRALLLLFTNFETMASLERQLPYLRRLASRHLVCVVFFQNTLLEELRAAQPATTEGIYIRTIADRFDYEKRQIVKELRQHGILSILSSPQNLTVDVINRYLELKARQMV